MTSKSIQERDETNSAGITWGIIFACLCVCLFVFVLLYYRRRVRNLKTEIAHVHYIADPPPPTDRHHFDNPVYAFPPPANDSTQLLNNLRPKVSNIDRWKLGPADDESSQGSSRAGTYSVNYNSDMSEKNKNADLTNPNMYHCIEDQLKEEHVYDEIKQKEGYKEPDEYDHLDYSNASSSFKPHYHRMNEALNIKVDLPDLEEKESNLPRNDLSHSPTDGNASNTSDEQNEFK